MGANMQAHSSTHTHAQKCIHITHMCASTLLWQRRLSQCRIIFFGQISVACGGFCRSRLNWNAVFSNFLMWIRSFKNYDFRRCADGLVNSRFFFSGGGPHRNFHRRAFNADCPSEMLAEMLIGNVKNAGEFYSKNHWWWVLIMFLPVFLSPQTVQRFILRDVSIPFHSPPLSILLDKRRDHSEVFSP